MILDPRSAAIFVFLAGLVLALTAIVANAQNAPTYTSRPVDWFDRDGNHVRYYRTRHRKHHYERRQEVRGWHSQARGYYPSHDLCRPVMTVVGEQHVSVEGAKDEARKSFSQTARWRHGERVMDVQHARDVRYECSRSSVGSVVGQVFHRCELTARPCRAEQQRED
jgi:phosphoribosyl-AMP cyclohydrolase